MIDILISALLVISGIFGLVGSVGLIKLPHLMMRLHAPTKATTVGVGGALIASMTYFYFVEGELSFHELMISIFLFLTAPVTGHFISKVHLHRSERPETLPSTGTRRPWASYESDAERAEAEGAANTEAQGQ